MQLRKCKMKEEQLKKVHFYEKHLFLLLAKAAPVLIISLDFSYACNEYKYTEQGPVLSRNLRNTNTFRKDKIFFKITAQQLNKFLQSHLTPPGWTHGDWCCVSWYLETPGVRFKFCLNLKEDGPSVQKIYFFASGLTKERKPDLVSIPANSWKSELGWSSDPLTKELLVIFPLLVELGSSSLDCYINVEVF